MEPMFNFIVIWRKWKLFTLYIFCSFSLEYCASGEDIPAFLNLAEDVPCGETEHLTKARILEGEMVQEAEFPFLASIQKSDMHFCSAFIINSQFLLTAAHCFIDSIYGSDAYKDYQIVVGSNDWTDRSNSSNLYKIADVRIHPKYSYLKPNVENDIALLTLDRAVQWSSKVQPICLANHEFSQYDSGVIAGWGVRAHKENMKDWMKDTSLHKVSLPIWSNSDCQSAYRRHRVNWNMRETHRMRKLVFCAGYQNNDKHKQDTSNGDSGSPLVIIHSGKRIAYGIVSVGEGSVLPGIYTRISEFIDFVNGNVH